MHDVVRVSLEAGIEQTGSHLLMIAVHKPVQAVALPSTRQRRRYTHFRPHLRAETYRYDSPTVPNYVRWLKQAQQLKTPETRHQPENRGKHLQCTVPAGHSRSPSALPHPES